MTGTATEALAPDMYAALTQVPKDVKDVLYLLKDFRGAGAAYQPSEAYKQQRAEKAEVRAQAMAMVYAIPASVRDSIPAEIIAGLLASTDAGQLEQFAAQLEHAIEDIKRHEETKMAAKHAEEAALEARLHKIWNKVEKLEEAVSDDIEELYRNNKITREQYLQLKRADQRVDAMPEGPEKAAAMLQRNALRREILEPIIEKAEREGDHATVNTGRHAVGVITEQDDLVNGALNIYKQRSSSALTPDRNIILESDHAILKNTTPTQVGREEISTADAALLGALGRHTSADITSRGLELLAGLEYDNQVTQSSLMGLRPEVPNLSPNVQGVARV